jgi:hypothetical protein
MSGFAKLHNSLLTSTIWREDPPTKVCWVTLLALADRDGVVEATIPGLAAIANISIEETESAIQKFLSPDKYSRTSDNEGRRIEVIDGGWRLINYEKYREKMSPEDMRERDRLRKQRYRDRQKQECPASDGTERDNSEMSAKSDIQIQKQIQKQKDKPSLSENSASLPVRYDADFDGLAAFEKTCSVYPKPERDFATQTAFFEAIGRIRTARACTDAEADQWLHSRAALYGQRINPTYAVGLEKFLRKEIYNQPEVAWGSAESADVPIRKTTSLPLSQRMAQEATYGN